MGLGQIQPINAKVRKKYQQKRSLNRSANTGEEQFLTVLSLSFSIALLTMLSSPFALFSNRTLFGCCGILEALCLPMKLSST